MPRTSKKTVLLEAAIAFLVTLPSGAGAAESREPSELTRIEKPASDQVEGATEPTNPDETTESESTTGADSNEGEFSIHAYVSFEMEYQIEDEGNGDPNGSFDADQVDVVFGYTKDRFRVALDAVFEHGSASEDDRGNVGLSFAFAEYAVNDKLVLRAGKFYSPLGVYNEFNTTKSAFLPVKIPLSTNKTSKLTGNGFNFFPRRQVGIGVLGAVPAGPGTISYDASISNGEQEETNPFEEDNNSQKALSARVKYEPSFSFNVGASLYSDRGTEEGSLLSYGVHTQYEGSRLLVWAEVDFGKLDLGGTGGPTIDQIGGFVDVGFPLQNGLTPYLQYQYAQTEAADLTESVNILIAGLNYTLGRHTKLKLENAYHEGSRDNLRFKDLPGRSYNELRAAIALGF